MSRPSWDAYFVQICNTIAQRSTCLRRKVGAVATKDHRLLASGYNGAPSGVKHCLDVGCLRAQLGVPSGQRQEICRGAHAEQNVIALAAHHGISLEGAVLYCTTRPCSMCAKSIINSGIHSVVYIEPYNDELATLLFRESGVQLYKGTVVSDIEVNLEREEL